MDTTKYTKQIFKNSNSYQLANVLCVLYGKYQF